jgi:hypothetical protein
MDSLGREAKLADTVGRGDGGSGGGRLGLRAAVGAVALLAASFVPLTLRPGGLRASSDVR